MSRENEVIKAIQYLWDEGFISLGYIDKKPAVFLTTSLREAQKAILAHIPDSADWWKK